MKLQKFIETKHNNYQTYTYSNIVVRIQNKINTHLNNSYLRWIYNDV